MTESLSDVVQSLRIETTFLTGCVRHIGQHRPPSFHTSRAEEEEIWDTGVMIGRGTFGAVRLERRRYPGNSAGSQVRVVKEVGKTVKSGARWDYMKELKALAKFSGARYEPYFVRTNGWFESDDCIFIIMDYFPLGDLERSMMASPPFSEKPASQIIRQLIEGVLFMHDNGFAHRDLKPQNILVASRVPQWRVKIADFGISKQAVEGGTNLRTMERGTPGYMAPEAMGFFRNSNLTNEYSVSVDIWSIGVITAELVLKQSPFRDPAHLYEYIYNRQTLDLDSVPGVDLSGPCRDFITGLMTPMYANRPTATDALRHPWLLEGVDYVNEELIDVDVLDGAVPASPPSLPWSDQQSSTGTLTPSYQGPDLDISTLEPSFRVLTLETFKYFVLRSDNAIDIETSVAHGVWTSSSRVNKILDKGYRRSGGQVILFFSVIGSRRFCGVARMTSPLDWDNTDEHWLEDSWQGRFTLEWLSLRELSFDAVRHVPVKPTTPGFRAIACYDGTEIAVTSAFELLREFSEARNT